MPRTALVLGATGMVGTLITQRLQSEGWPVVIASRRAPAAGSTAGPAARHVAVDLLDAADCRRAFAAERDITHVFYAGRAPHGEGGIESVEDNLAMLINAVEAIEAAAPGLRHVHLVHGTKYYGNHLGAYKTPAEEDDPRPDSPNFYYDQQDYVAGRNAPWSWSVVRPPLVFDFTPGKPRNLVSVLAVYAAIRRELGLKFSFPGTETAYQCLAECAEAVHVAKASVWMAGDERCANQAFNISNGDIFRWESMWHRFAEHFGMEVGPPLGISLAEAMPEHAALWDRIVAKHGLRPTPYEDMALWNYADYVFRPTWDIISDTTKARQFGFPDVVKSQTMFVDLLDRYRDARLIP